MIFREEGVKAMLHGGHRINERRAGKQAFSAPNTHGIRCDSAQAVAKHIALSPQ
jgi:hypothetical protein